MICPRCDGKTQVTDSRGAPHNTIRRRRECVACGHRFTTYESTISPLRTLKVVGGQAERSRRYYQNLPEDVRKARAKRSNNRAAAREEAARTGEPVAAIYKRMGVE